MPHIVKKKDAYWVFSSCQASLDCLPQYKTKTLAEAQRTARVIKHKQRVKWLTT